MTTLAKAIVIIVLAAHLGGCLPALMLLNFVPVIITDEAPPETEEE